MWDLKYDANAFIYEAETDSQTENRLSSPISRMWEGMDWEFGIGRGKLPLYIYICIMSICIAQAAVFNIL